ncbi:hypothetical protein BST61_g2014 [Cercospora zeina]
MSSSLYDRLARDDQLIEVDMNEVQVLDPTKDDEIAIGTKDLNGCTTIVFMDRGAILAHIAPMGPKGEDGMKHFQSQVAAALRLMKKHPELFKSTTTWGIFARVGQDFPLQHCATWLRKMLIHLEAPFHQAYYDVDPKDRRVRSLPIGSVVVVRQGGAFTLYVEDRPQTPNTQQTWTVRSATASTSAGPSTQPTQATSNIPAATANPSMAASEWRYSQGTYSLVQDGRVLKTQPTAPEKERYYHADKGFWAMVDGNDKWVSTGKGWTRV